MPIALSDKQDHQIMLMEENAPDCLISVNYQDSREDAVKAALFHMEDEHPLSPPHLATIVRFDDGHRLWIAIERGGGDQKLEITHVFFDPGATQTGYEAFTLSITHRELYQ